MANETNKPKQTDPKADETAKQGDAPAENKSAPENAAMAPSAEPSAPAVAPSQDQVIAMLMANQQKLEANLAELQAELNALKQPKDSPKAPIHLHGPAIPARAAQTMAAIWPKDAERIAGDVVTKTFLVEPVGAALNEGWGPAIVDNCMDEADAKATYLKRYKPELHGLPLMISRYKLETVQEVKTELSAA